MRSMHPLLATEEDLAIDDYDPDNPDAWEEAEDGHL